MVPMQIAATTPRLISLFGGSFLASTPGSFLASVEAPTQKPHLSRRSSVSSIGQGRDDDKLAQDAEPEHRVLKPASIG